MPILLLDGGFSSQLSCHVGDKVDGDPLWTARFLNTNPDDVIKTHLDFLRAGAQAILTNTYQASIGGFVKHLQVTEDDAYQLIKTAVDLAREAIKTYFKEVPSCKAVPIIVGSVGPYGAYLHDGSEYSGHYADVVSKEKMKEWHSPRIQALLEAGVDMLALETIPCEKEAQALGELLREFPNAKAWMSFSCKDSQTLANGEPFKDVAIQCWEANKDQLVAIGANCLSPEYVEDLFRPINEGRSNKIPLVVYPNSGEKYKPDQGWTEKEKCKTLDHYVFNWLNLGVCYVGGCCRTYASDIALMKKELERWKHENNYSE